MRPCLPPPPRRQSPRPLSRPRAQTAPEPARSRLCAAGSPPGRRAPFQLPAGPPATPALGRPRPTRLPWWAPHRQAEEPGPAAPWPGGRPRFSRMGREAASGLLGVQLSRETSTKPPPPPPPREKPLRLEPPAPPQPRAETDPSADLRLLILTAGNKQCAGAVGWGGT